MDDYCDVKGEKFTLRVLKLRDSGKKFVPAATLLIIVIIVNFGTCPAGPVLLYGPRAWRNSQLPPWSSPRDLEAPERPVIYDGVFRPLWKGVQRQGRQSECGRPAASSPHTD